MPIVLSRHVRAAVPFTWVVALAVSVSCGGSSSSDCDDDSQCPDGQGCYRAGSEGYCSPLCTYDSQCEGQTYCPSGDFEPDFAHCREIGEHKGGEGVCDLYVGDFTPDNCADAEPGCVGTMFGGCFCEYSPPSDQPSVCSEDTVSFGSCCADPAWPSEGRCSCRPYACVMSADSCECKLAPEAPPSTWTSSCPPIDGGACCELWSPVSGTYSCECSAFNGEHGCGPGELLTASCEASDRTCATGERATNACL